MTDTPGTLEDDISEIAPTMDALEQWMKDRGDLPEGANGWRERCEADPKTVATAVAFVRIARASAADEIASLRAALTEIAHETRRQQLPITALVNEIARQALKDSDNA